MDTVSSPILLPKALGLPTKFTEFRPHQAEIAVDIAASEARFSCLSMPTGGGKSLVYMTIAQILDARALVLVGTKGLQGQIATDFNDLDLTDIKGQSNYRCLAVNFGGELESYGTPGTTCNEGPCKASIKCSLKHSGCTYYDTVREAAKSRVVISNYAYWLTVGRHADPMTLGKFDLLILDEAHTAPDWLADGCTVKLDRQEVRALLSMDLPPIDEGVAVWSSWAKEAAVIASAKWDQLKDQTTSSRIDRKRLVKQLLQVGSLMRDLDELALAHAWRAGEGPQRDVRLPGLHVDWVAQHTDKGAKFTPVWAHPYAEEYLFRGIPKVVLSSATLTPSITKYLGINPTTSDWHESKASFDHRRRPIIYIPTTRIDNRATEGQVRVWVNRIDKIVEGRQDRKGIIASVSYARAEEILKRSRFKELMVGHTSRTTRDVVAAFKQSSAPKVLVSPAMVEGYDFPGDQCRYIIIAKIPFSDGRDPVEKARRKSDKEWASYTTALTLVQTCGRGMRAEDDLCEIFIIDDHWVWYKSTTEFPQWFRKAWREVPVVPKALPLPGLEV
jgi:ATP-dependent DNA helicase DinG